MKLLYKSLPLAAALSTIPAGLALADQNLPRLGDDWAYGHMGYGMGWSGWFLGPVMMILFIALAVAAVVVTLRLLGVGGTSAGRGNALQVLDERFARGEIDKAEYEERRRALNS